MSSYTSSDFISSAAPGEDWREAAKAVLAQLEPAAQERRDFNIGFLYISDLLVDDASGIVSLFSSVLGIEHWVGTVGVGICAPGKSYIDEPAISAMIGHLNPDEFKVFQDSQSDPDAGLDEWVKTHDPMLILTHGNPISEQDPAAALQELEGRTGGFLLGGLSSSRTTHIQFADGLAEGDLSGLALSQSVKIATTLSQGCKPIGEPHIITRGSEHVIREIDGSKASEVFENDLRAMATEKIGINPDTVIIDEDLLDEENPVPEEFRTLLQGEIHIAFPVSQSDQQDYLVRNIMGIDPDEGAMAVSENVVNGESIVFVHRDEKTVRDDLQQQLSELRRRVEKDTGEFKPKAGIYVSCVARGFSQNDGDGVNEMALIQSIIGDIPLTGFYAGGEINNARLYGYTGILTLFL